MTASGQLSLPAPGEDAHPPHARTSRRRLAYRLVIAVGGAAVMFGGLFLLRPPGAYPLRPITDAPPGQTATTAEPLLERVFEAHGGLDRWRRVERLRVQLRFGGLAFRLRWAEPEPLPRRVELDLRSPLAVFADYPEAGSTGHFSADRVWIQDGAGHLRAEQTTPQDRLLRSRLRQLVWTDLDLLYFAGYALWNYVQGPFLLAREGIETTELAPWRDGDESWRRLLARFPNTIPTHSREQVFYFDSQFRQRRRDYDPRVYAGWAQAAHLCDAYRSFGGFSLPTRRRVVPRRADGTAADRPTLVWIDILDVEWVPS